MKNNYILIFTIVLLTSCQKTDEWSLLFNGNNLQNWDLHIGTPIKGFEELATSATPESVFSIVEFNGENVIRISGHVNAAMATKEGFENYHLQMEFRWHNDVFGSRNSGLLYHSYGPFGAGLGTWMNSHELQLMTGNLGDSYRMGDTYCEIPAVEEDGQFHFKTSADRKPFGVGGVSKIARKNKNMEKPIGEWNLVDLFCFGDVSVHVINGEMVMVNYNSRKYEENGETTPLTSGKIQFQSEGGELFIRNLKIKSIDKIPDEILP